MNRVWKPIHGYENVYCISNCGEIYSVRNHRMLSLKKTAQGYLRIGLSVCGIRTDYMVHRLVALAFIPNTYNKPTVNHINEIKTDNRADNLEWATMAEQNSHGTRTNRAISNTDWVVRTAKIDYTEVARKHDYYKINKKQMKPVLQYDENGIFIASYEGLSIAARNVKVSPGGICECIKGRRKTCGGYKWKYA